MEEEVIGREREEEEEEVEGVEREREEAMSVVVVKSLGRRVMKWCIWKGKGKRDASRSSQRRLACGEEDWEGSYEVPFFCVGVVYLQ